MSAPSRRSPVGQPSGPSWRTLSILLTTAMRLIVTVGRSVLLGAKALPVQRPTRFGESLSRETPT
jgi:hypothetical protein